MRIPARLIVMLVAALACGCTQRVYSVGTKNPERSVPAGATTVQVLREPTSAASEFEEAFERKLSRVLRDEGYDVVEATATSHILYYDYSTYALMANMRLEMLAGARKGMTTVRKGGPYVHSLRLTLVETSAESQAPSGRAIVWEGGAVMSGPTESNKFHDLLIIAAVDQLGKTTADTVVARMSLNHARARRLRK